MSTLDREEVDVPQEFIPDRRVYITGSPTDEIQAAAEEIGQMTGTEHTGRILESLQVLVTFCDVPMSEARRSVRQNYEGDRE